jgi:cytoskeletal protein CcmA (bactofilin family)
MSDIPRRRFLDRLSGTPSLFSAGSRFNGDVETAGALMIGGHVIGDGRIGGELSIGPDAHWEGNVYAHRAVVAGKITGSIVVSEKIEIAATAVIRGRVSASHIAMALGATIDGEVAVTGTEPIVEFEERRTVDAANAAQK